jgi:hypothetical protein
MERNRWETAIRCLEVALHPHTSDGEVIAAVNGFRRTAAGIPLRDICAAFTAGTDADGAAAAEVALWRLKLERLQQDYRALQRRLDRAESRRTEAERRAETAERAVRVLQEELAASRDCSSPAAVGVTEAGRTGYVDKPEAAARRSFTPAAPVEPSAASLKPPFQKILEAAQADPWTA